MKIRSTEQPNMVEVLVGDVVVRVYGAITWTVSRHGFWEDMKVHEAREVLESAELEFNHIVNNLPAHELYREPQGVIPVYHSNHFRAMLLDRLITQVKMFLADEILLERR